MKQLRVLALVGLSAWMWIGCGGSAPRREGPVTSSWSEADDAALGVAPAPTSGGESD